MLTNHEYWNSTTTTTFIILRPWPPCRTGSVYNVTHGIFTKKASFCLIYGNYDQSTMTFYKNFGGREENNITVLCLCIMWDFIEIFVYNRIRPNLLKLPNVLRQSFENINLINSKTGLIIGSFSQRGTQHVSTSNNLYVLNNSVVHLLFSDPLEYLHFSSLFKISDEGISHVSQCRDLLELCVSSCYGVTDKSITEITQHCLKLKELDVSWCPLVTDTGLKPLLSNVQLQLLRIKCCKRVGVL